MSSSLYRRLVIGAACALMLFVGATSLAGATTGTGNSSSNAATLTLSVKVKRALARQHLSLRATRPAARRKSTYALPESSGKWNFLTATGTLNFKGVLAIVLGKRSLKLGSVTFTRPAKGNGSVTAKLARRPVKLFTITGRPRIKRAASTETLSGMTAKLTKPGAARIDASLHRSAFSAGERFGSFSVTISTSPITFATSSGSGPGAGGAGTGAGGPTVTGANSSGAGLQLAPAFRSLLGSAGLSTLPLVPASNGLPAPLGTTTIPGADGTSVTLPLNGSPASASFANGTLTGTIPLSGGLQLGNGQVSVSLTNPQLTLGTGTEGSSLSFQVNGGPEVKAFDIDTSQLEQSTLPNGTLDLQGLLATLSSEGASSLNQALGQNVFTTGQPVGGLSLIVPAPQG
jgi:hypothetical protein